MCVIGGILNRDLRKANDREILEKMTDMTVYRGPDERGIFIDGNIGFGHCRLPIIGLASGQQPINKVGIRLAERLIVRFLGYVPEPKSCGRLAEAQVAVDLTKEENCLVCGAYEAMVLEKPRAVSTTLALRNCFSAGTDFVDHKPELTGPMDE